MLSVVLEINPNMNVLGPIFKSKIDRAIKALNNTPNIAEKVKMGNLTIDLDGEIAEIDPKAIEIKKEVILRGKAVDVIQVGDAIVTISR